MRTRAKSRCSSLSTKPETSNSSPSENLAETCCAPYTTCQDVTANPFESMTKPVPTLTSVDDLTCNVITDRTILLYRSVGDGISTDPAVDDPVCDSAPTGKRSNMHIAIEEIT